jgi:hypothetical protein
MIEHGDKLGKIPPAQPEPAPKRSEDLDPLVPKQSEPSDPFDLGIGATVSGRNLRALEAAGPSFRRRPSRYQ